MINKQQIKHLIQRRNLSLTESEVDIQINRLFNEISNNNYDFSTYNRNIITQHKKKRIVYDYDKLSCEDILCQYLKKQIDLVFQVKYASRSKIINIMFNVLPMIKDMKDFVIIRADFKSFFDTVLVKHIMDKFIIKSSLKRYDKELLEEYAREFKYCHAGLCLSNSMTEIVCRDFDQKIKAKLYQHGVFFYERYVDDILIIMNKYITIEKFMDILNSTVREVFGESPVKLSDDPDKFAYIAKRNINTETIEKIQFLGYEFELDFDGNQINFKYGISKKKRDKQSNIIKRAIIDYRSNNNLELLRQRIKMYSTRVVIARNIGNSTFNWLTQGIVANYNELQHHIDCLTEDTDHFLKNIYLNLLSQERISLPYFMVQSRRENSVYNLYSNMKRNRTIIFHESIGVSRQTLLNWIQKIDSSYFDSGKSYYRIVLDYLEKIKIK